MVASAAKQSMKYIIVGQVECKAKPSINDTNLLRRDGIAQALFNIFTLLNGNGTMLCWAISNNKEPNQCHDQYKQTNHIESPIPAHAFDK